MGSSRATAHRGWLLAILLSMTFMYQVDVTIVNVASPSIRADLHASGAQLELVISGYLLASAMLLITGARLGYQRGYRPVFLTGLGIFGAASLACGLAPDTNLLIAARVLQGIGGALAFPQVLTEATPRYAADISGVFTTCMQIAGAIGVVAFGTLYLSQDTGQGAQSASHAFGLVTGAFALISTAAAVAAYRAIRSTSPLSVPRSRDDASMAGGPGAATCQAGQGPRPGTALPSSLWPDPSDSRRSGHCRPHSRARTVGA